MGRCATVAENDLMGSFPAVGLLWIAPWMLIAAGAGYGNPVHTARWTAGFAVMGTACLVNARRCGRRHCFYTGPLLLAALASLLHGLGVLPLGRHGWSWIAGVALGGSILACCGLERIMGRYAARHPSDP